MFTLIPVFSVSTFAQTDKNGTQIQEAIPISAQLPEIEGIAFEGTYADLHFLVVMGTGNAKAYRAFAVRAEEERYFVIANLFRATADAEAKHSDDGWTILQEMGETERPDIAGAWLIIRSTAQNLQASFASETLDYTVRYSGFLETAQKEGNAKAERIFKLAMSAGEVHANNYQDALAKLSDTDYINEKYSEVYRCVVCGEVVTERPNQCSTCGALSKTFVSYKATGKSMLPDSVINILIATIAIIVAIIATISLIKKRSK
jgi:rubrerythrin